MDALFFQVKRLIIVTNFLGSTADHASGITGAASRSARSGRRIGSAAATARDGAASARDGVAGTMSSAAETASSVPGQARHATRGNHGR